MKEVNEKWKQWNDDTRKTVLIRTIKERDEARMQVAIKDGQLEGNRIMANPGPEIERLNILYGSTKSLYEDSVEELKQQKEKYFQLGVELRNGMVY